MFKRNFSDAFRSLCCVAVVLYCGAVLGMNIPKDRTSNDELALKAEKAVSTLHDKIISAIPKEEDDSTVRTIHDMLKSMTSVYGGIIFMAGIRVGVWEEPFFRETSISTSVFGEQMLPGMISESEYGKLTFTAISVPNFEK